VLYIHSNIAGTLKRMCTSLDLQNTQREFLLNKYIFQAPRSQKKLVGLIAFTAMFFSFYLICFLKLNLWHLNAIAKDVQVSKKNRVFIEIIGDYNK
jgi:hypothetical protein